MKNSKMKKAAGTFILCAIYILFGFFFGLFLMQYLSDHPQADEIIGGETLYFIILLLSLYFGLFLQIIIHEAGHLVFGLLSGYKFSSFRIANFMWLKENGEIKFKRHSIAGTVGQCLMIPPDFNDGKFPAVLYNLGGSLMNILAGLLFLALYFILKNVPIVPIIMLVIAFVGFLTAVTNGVPMRTGTVDNDGYNAFITARNSKARRAFWIQMKINEQIAKGVRIKDMPEKWFALPADAEMKNGLVAAVGVLASNRLLDELRFDEARELIDHLLDIDCSMAGLHRYLLVCDRIFLELIGENSKSVIDRLYTKKQKRFMKSMKNYVSVLRTEYAYALLAEKDSAKADKIRAQFEKSALSYPYPIEVISERELMDIAANRLQG